MKPEDRTKLNKCLKILETTDLGLSMVWLWTWSTITGLIKDGDFKCTTTEKEIWDGLCESVAAGMGFSLEYGAEQHYEEIRDWMLSRKYLVDLEEGEE